MQVLCRVDDQNDSCSSTRGRVRQLRYLPHTDHRHGLGSGLPSPLDLPHARFLPSGEATCCVHIVTIDCIARVVKDNQVMATILVVPEDSLLQTLPRLGADQDFWQLGIWALFALHDRRYP